MRVLHVITTLDRGGAEKALLALCRGSRAADPGRAVAVAFLKGRGELAPEFEACGVAVHDLDVRGIRAARSLASLAGLVREFAPDVVHSHLFKADVLAASVVGGRAALVSTKHNVDVYLENPAWRVLGRAAARRADAVVAVSDGVAQFLARTLGELRGRGDRRTPVKVVRYGVEAPAAPVVPAPGRASLVCPARFEPQKDHATLLDAIEMAARERDLRLVLLGRGPLEPALQARARTIPHAEIVFAGFADDPTPYYDAADAVVLASRWEGLGLVLVEAALRGRPAIATEVGGIPEVVEPRVTGLLAPPGDPRGLADQILTLVCNPGPAAVMGANAKARAAERFGVARCVAETDAVYAAALEARR